MPRVPEEEHQLDDVWNRKTEEQQVTSVASTTGPAKNANQPRGTMVLPILVPEVERQRGTVMRKSQSNSAADCQQRDAPVEPAMIGNVTSGAKISRNVSNPGDSIILRAKCAR
jgi:hypothetical protein